MYSAENVNLKLIKKKEKDLINGSEDFCKI